MRDVQVYSQESKVSHTDFLSTKAFLVRAYLKDVSQKFLEQNFKTNIENRKNNVYVCE